MRSMDSQSIIRIQLGVIVILLALLIAPYFVNRPHVENTSSTGEMNGMSPAMMQKMYALDTAHVAIPTIAFTIKKDSLDGWDLHVDTSNFTFTPQNINMAPIADQGHVHLYIDGKLTVLMGPWFHVDGSAISPGKHDIVVSLNANDHSVFAYQGKPLQSEQILYAY